MEALRFGWFATYRGADYELIRDDRAADEYVIRSMVPQEGFMPGRVGYLKTLRSADLEQAFSVTNRCRYHDALVNIQSHQNGKLLLSSFSELDGFRMLDRGVYEKEVDDRDPGILNIWEIRKALPGFTVEEAKVEIYSK